MLESLVLGEESKGRQMETVTLSDNINERKQWEILVVVIHESLVRSVIMTTIVALGTKCTQVETYRTPEARIHEYYDNPCEPEDNKKNLIQPLLHVL